MRIELEDLFDWPAPFLPNESNELELAPLLLRTGWRTFEELPTELF